MSETCKPSPNSLSAILDQGPGNLEKLLVTSGQAFVDIKEKNIDVKAQREKHIKQLFCRGALLRHKKRGTKVTIIKANVAEGKHKVVESRTGKEFIANQDNLEPVE